MDPYISTKTKPLYRGTQIVWYILTILESLLALRFILKLTGANAGAGFTNFIYAVTSPFTAPFRAVFRSTAVSGSIFEWTTLLAMAIYWLLAVAVIRLFVMSKPMTTPEAARKLEQQEMP